MPLTNSNTINTRIRLKYDTYANWMESTLPIFPGEMCVALVDLGQNEVTGAQIIEGQQQVGYKPAILVKIGDGVTITDPTTNILRYKTFAELDYIQAKAGDVYGWAKAPTQPTAVNLDIGANATGEQITRNGSTIWTWLNNLDGKSDTDTIYELEAGSGDNAGKIRLNYKAKGSSSAMTPGTWIPVGSTLSAADNSIDITNDAISAKISSNTNNALSVNSTSGEEGLFVPKVSFNTSNQPANTQINLPVVTGFTALDNPNQFTVQYSTVYTKAAIDNLINPSMEFKGVATASELDNMTLNNSMLGESYKLSTNGTNQLTDENLQTAKIGDLAIVCQKEIFNELLNETDYEYCWEIIPSGDESTTDTYRSILMNDNQILSSSIASGGIDFVAGTGVQLSTDSRTIGTGSSAYTVTGLTIGLDNTVPTVTDINNLKAHTDYQNLGTYEDNGTTRNHTVKTYIDEQISTIDVANLIQSDTYLIFNCGNANGWQSPTQNTSGD